MALSSQTVYTKTKLELMDSVFRELNIKGQGLTASSDDYAILSNIINDMFKSWTTDGPHLWATEEAVVFAEQYQSKYKIADTAHATTLDDLVMTQINGALLSGVSSLTVDSTANMTIGDFIGIVCSDKSLFWTTIATIPTSTTLTINNALTKNVVDNAYVFTYTTALDRPLDISNIRSVSGIDLGATSTLTELPVEKITRSEYMDLPIKTQNNTHITNAYYVPKRITGELLVYPRPSDCSYRIQFSYARDLAMVINTDDELDFPQEWYECIKYQIMVRAAETWGKTGDKIDRITSKASRMLEKLQMKDQENMYIDVVPRCN